METIQVRYTFIDNLPFNIQAYHKQIVYTDSAGNQYIAEAIPTNRPDSPSAVIDAETGGDSPFGPINSRIIPYDPDESYKELITSGDDLSNQWDSIKQTFEEIGNGQTPYRPFSQNSNTTVDEALQRAGLPLPSEDGVGHHFSPGSKGFEGIVGDLIDAIRALGNIDEWYKHIDELVDTFFRSSDKYRPPVRYDPLTLDLDGDGLETAGTTAGILFDQTGNGVKTGTGWVKPDDGFLVLDKNGNGLIDNGRELFGDSTLKSNGQLALDGFDALRDLDSNADGKVDVSDAQFNNLKVWRDLNQDGTTQNGELFTLGQLNIASINTGSTANSQTLPDGNQIADLGTYTRTDGSTGTTGEVTGNLGDINLAQDTFHRQFTTHPDTSVVASLPDMRGSGAVRDLREAANDYRWRMAA
jgi:hypothetical protein